MSFSRIIAPILLLFLFSPTISAQQRAPKIGYVYPAGGRQGTTVRVLLGGRQIARSTEIVVSGTGVQARVIRTFSRMNLNGAEDNFVARQIYNAAKKQVEGEELLPENEERLIETVRKQLAKKQAGSSGLPKSLDPDALPSPEDVVRRFPYWDELAEPTPEALQKVFYEYFAPRSDKKPKEAIGQGVLAEITISADAEPGDRDVRLLGPLGLTPPMRFMVGSLPEVMELEPNDTDSENPTPMELWKRQIANAPKTLRKLPPADLPVVFNGQIRAGDVDRFQFHARQGQKLVIPVQAQYLIPFLADGVPGWFQAVVSLYGSDGKKIDEAMSYQYEPDPVILFDVPKTGVYSLEIQDTVFRGRDDFVYRITVGELPWVTSMFPLGTQQGTATGADLDGWNLPERAALLDGERKSDGIYEITTVNNTRLLRPLRCAVDALPQICEKESNNSVENAENVELPIIVNGRISDENDVDCFAFQGRQGDRIVVDVCARNLGSSLDAVIEVLDLQGNILFSNDDRANSSGPNIGRQTHHADPYLNVELPDTMKYVVRLCDATQRGGKDYGYRLRISSPCPDFSVFCKPASLTLRGNRQSLKIHLVRKDGFSGEVRLMTPPGSPFHIENGVIEAGANEATVELSARNFAGTLSEVAIDAVAEIDGRELVRPMIAVEDWEQAFIYHHWVPARSLMVYKPSSGFRQRNR